MKEAPEFGVHKMNSQEIIDEVQKTPGSPRHPLQFWINPYKYLRFRVDIAIHNDDATMVQSLIDSIRRRYNEDGKSLDEIENAYMRTYLDESIDYRDRIESFMKIMRLSNLKKSHMQAWIENEKLVKEESSQRQFQLKTIESVMNEVYGDED
jgi:hypothetical protein